MTDWHSLTDEQIMDLDLIIALGLASAPDDDKQALIDQMATSVQKAIALRVGNEIDPSKQNDLLKLLESQDHDAINAFFEANIPHFGDIIIEETVKFKRAMLQPKQSSH